mgnify:CR=1 FL=1
MKSEATAQSLYSQLEAAVPRGLAVPDALRKLYVWIGENGMVGDGGIEGVKGWLYNPDRFPKRPDDDDEEEAYCYGTQIEFSGRDDLYYSSWFGSTNPEIRERLCIFAKTGGDGSRAGLWFDDANQARMVHLGSGSGSTFVGLIGNEPVDFLRLIAIGYTEICWDEYFSEPPRQEDGIHLVPDVAFQNWVKETFGVTIPKTASEIVPDPGHMSDQSPKDSFAKWVWKMTGRIP